MNERPWDPEELAWARECLAAGDTLEEIAAVSSRDLADVERAVGRVRISTLQREIASLYAAGFTFAEIDEIRGVRNPKFPGKAASMVISRLRTAKRLPIPYRLPECA